MAAAAWLSRGELQIASVTLPDGVHIVSEYGTGHPVAWATIQPVPEPGKIWAALSAAHPQTGLMPFLLEGIGPGDPGDTQRPWDEGEFDDLADIAELGRLDAAEVPESWWNGQLEPLQEGQDEDPADILGPAAVQPPLPRAWPPQRPCRGTLGNSSSLCPGRSGYAQPTSTRPGPQGYAFAHSVGHIHPGGLRTSIR